MSGPSCFLALLCLMVGEDALPPPAGSVEAAVRIGGALKLTSGAEPPAGARPRFVPMDLERFFTAGPLSQPDPPSTLLPAGATELHLTVKASAPTTCRYSVGKELPWERMTRLGSQDPSRSPAGAVRGLNPDPAHVNDVYVRPASAPEAVLHLRYRCLPAIKPGFPRTANLWGSWRFRGRALEHARRIDLWLGAEFSADQVRQRRAENPNVLILDSINTVENNDVPDEYFLRDTTGRKIEVWPGAYRLNLTRPEVAEYQARYAYQRMLEKGLMYDGCFFDNFMTSQSWQTHDIYDRPVQIDADGDGKADDKQAFDRAWREGVFRELRAWRKLMPWALTSGHSQGYPHPEIAAIFNGQGIGFLTTDVIEGKTPFHELWDHYNAWCTVAVKPAITSVESAVPDQIAYGYDYTPERHTPPSTWTFARDYFPYMRFGLAFTLMNDGYFSHELGDTDHGQDWWYDELDFKLGAPLGPARRVAVSPSADRELAENGGFEQSLEGTWTLWFDRPGGCAAAVARDTRERRSGAAAARIHVTSGGRTGGIELIQGGRGLQRGRIYTLRFAARADRSLPIVVVSSKSSPPWDNYGLSRDVRLSQAWQNFELTFEARATASDARIQFIGGGETGTIWIDDVSLRERGDEILRRDFQNGLALLNATRRRQTIDVGPGFARLSGAQAPRHQYILDDAGPGFQTTGAWREVPLGTREWHATPPFYHAWNQRCHLRSGNSGEAVWELDLRGPGTYTVQAWWAAAPEARTWTSKAVYEVVAGDRVVASATLDQTRNGDQWHTLAEGVPLEPGQRPTVRVRSADGAVLAADALHVFSAERYNDGTPAQHVTLEPMDGIVLRRDPAGSR